MIPIIILFLIIICLVIINILLIKNTLNRTLEKRIITNTIYKKKLEDDFIQEKEEDIININKYLKYIKESIDKYNNSRSKKISFRTRRSLLYYTILFIPYFTKYTEISFDYDIDSIYWKKLDDRDIMKNLIESYNSFSIESPESFNDIVKNILLLSDNR